MGNAQIRRYLKLIPHLPRIYLSGNRYVFVLSHMRSYSSLLSHILGSNPEIAGHSETHQKYRNTIDLFKLRAKIFESASGSLIKRYALDKILHNENAISNGILSSSSLRTIFLVRKPHATMQSIMKMGKQYVDVQWYQDPEQVTHYYVSRLERLGEMARHTATRGLFIKSEDILSRCDDVLCSVSRYLELSNELNQEYTIFSNTGMPSLGDPSPNIKEGKVKHPTDKKDPEFWIPTHLLSRAEDAYELCTEVLTQACDQA